MLTLAGGVMMLLGWVAKDLGWPPQIVPYDRALMAFGTGVGLFGLSLIRKARHGRTVDAALAADQKPSPTGLILSGLTVPERTSQTVGRGGERPSRCTPYQLAGQREAGVSQTLA